MHKYVTNDELCTNMLPMMDYKYYTNKFKNHAHSANLPLFLNASLRFALHIRKSYRFYFLCTA